MANADVQAAWVERVLGVSLSGGGAASQTAGASGIAGGDPGVGERGAAVRLAQGLLQWNSTRSHVASEISKLQSAIVTEMQDHPEFDEIVAHIENLDNVLDHLDDRLGDVLGEMREAASPAAKGRLSTQARRLVGEMQAYVAGDPLMQDIDDNGFVPLSVRSRVEQTLSSILQAI